MRPPASTYSRFGNIAAIPELADSAITWSRQTLNSASVEMTNAPTRSLAMPAKIATMSGRPARTSTISSFPWASVTACTSRMRSMVVLARIAVDHKAWVLEAFEEGVKAVHDRGQHHAVENADLRQRWLLRARSERPRSGAAEEGDELASPDADCHLPSVCAGSGPFDVQE